jgi:iron complex transport system permease protein
MNRTITIRSQSGRWSFHAQKKTLLTLAILISVLLVVLVLSVGLGSKLISPVQALTTILGKGSVEHALIINMLRLPRMLVALLVGAALGVSGAILQGMIRNPLASPDVMGITGGAALAAVAFITFFSGRVSIAWLPPAAFAGAGLISVIIYLLAWKKGVSPVRLVLIGIGISARTSAATMFLIMVSPITSASQAYTWLTGSFYGVSWTNALTLLPWVAVGLPLAFICSRHLTVQGLGDDTARGLGARVQIHRCVMLLLSVSLAGSAVAIAGAVGFVGLIAPHMARRLVGPSFGGLLPTAALLGSILTVLADTAARTVFLPMDIPAGVFTAGVGAPFFIYLLYRSRNQ